MKCSRHTPEMIKRYLDEGYWTEDNRGELWDRCAMTNPNKVALVDSHVRLTFADAKRWSDRIALAFHELGITREDALAAQFPNRVDAFLTWNAAEKIGVPMARCPTQLRHKEMLHMLRVTKAVGIVTPAVYRDFSYIDMIREIRAELPGLKHIFVVGDEVPPGTISINDLINTPYEERHPKDFLRLNRIRSGEVCYLQTTSGTTGLPKIVEMPAQGVNPYLQYQQRWKITTDDVMACIGPFYGGAGYAVWGAPAVVGARVVFMEKFEPEAALQLIQDERVTFICSVPAQLALMVRHPNFDQYDLSSLRTIYYAAAAFPYSLLQEVEQKMGCRVLANYGMTEGGVIATGGYDDPPKIRALSVGQPIVGVEVKLVDDAGVEVPTGETGEIHVRGGMAASGFAGDPAATLAAWGPNPDGWINTGDLGRLDEEGNVYIVGRSKDVIIRGGQNMYPKEVEDILITHPKVLDVAIVSMPDPVMGEKACACVIPRSEQDLLGFDEMVAFLKRERMAAYKLPERLEIVREFPMSGDGQKVLKRALTAEITRKLKEEGKIN